MQEFSYTAVTVDDRNEIGTIKSPNADEAVCALHLRALVILRLEPITPFTRLLRFLNQDLSERSILGRSQLADLAREWGSLLESGIPLDEALSLTMPTSGRKSLAACIERILTAVREGKSLSAALTATERFPSDFVAIVRAAEEAGKLGASLTRLGRELMDSVEFRNELRNALLYPCFIFMAASAAILFLLIWVVPTIEELIAQSGSERMADSSKFVLAASWFVRQHGLKLLLVMAAIGLAILVGFRTTTIRMLFDAALFGIPIVGRLYTTILTAKVLRLLADALGNGVSAAQALKMAAEATANRVLRLKLETALEALIRGVSLAEALEGGPLLADAIRVVRIGERTGELHRLCAQAASSFERRSRANLKSITIIVGPALTVVFGAVAGLIMYAIMTTLLTMNELVLR